MAYVVVGMVPVDKRNTCICSWCNTNKSVKYILEEKVELAGIPPYDKTYWNKRESTTVLPRWFCCNKCVTRVATFIRVDKELPANMSEETIDKEP